MTFKAGVPWADSLPMPLADTLDIAETHLDGEAMAHYRQAETVWASIAPHVTNKMPVPKPPDLSK